MGRNVPYPRRKRADALPLCIFPKGKRAGIRCVTLKIFTVGGKTVQIFEETACAYHPLEVEAQ